MVWWHIIPSELSIISGDNWLPKKLLKQNKGPYQMFGFTPKNPQSLVKGKSFKHVS